MGGAALLRGAVEPPRQNCARHWEGTLPRLEHFAAARRREAVARARLRGLAARAPLPARAEVTVLPPILPVDRQDVAAWALMIAVVRPSRPEIPVLQSWPIVGAEAVVPT